VTVLMIVTVAVGAGQLAAGVLVAFAAVVGACGARVKGWMVFTVLVS
jgi:hypothetical protein